MNTRKFLIIIVIFLLILQSATFALDKAAALDRASRNKPNTSSNQSAEMARILPVLKSKIGDQKLLGKAKDKLASMDDSEIRLIASLCERASNNRGTPEGDIAFLFVTALIVLS